MVKIIDTLLGKSSGSSDDDYMELDLASYEEHGGASPALLVKIATITDLKIHPASRTRSTAATLSSSTSPGSRWTRSPTSVY